MIWLHTSLVKSFDPKSVKWSVLRDLADPARADLTRVVINILNRVGGYIKNGYVGFSGI